MTHKSGWWCGRWNHWSKLTYISEKMTYRGKINSNLHRCLSYIPDRLYLRLRYRQRVGNWPDLNNPKKFTEKLQWLKLHDRNEALPILADKLQLKAFVKQRIGAQYTIPVLSWGNTADQFTINTPPAAPFVLKTNHDSGSTRVFLNFENLDIRGIQKWLREKLSANFYLANREWEYESISPKWFIEPLLEDDSGNSRLNDFKVHCFHGAPFFIQTIFDRDSKPKENWFDVHWKPVNIYYFSEYKAHVPKPSCLSEILSIAKTLSADFYYVRVDFYIRKGRPLVGEMTFRPYGGFMKWNPDSADYMLGNLLNVGN